MDVVLVSVCTSLENADDYPVPGARPGLGGSGSRYGIAFPTARCLSGVDAESRSATCLVYAGNGMPAGPVTATLVVTTTSAGWFGDEERLTSFLTVS